MVNKKDKSLINDDDCDRPACADTVSMLRSAMERSGNKVGGKAKTTKLSPTLRMECPPGKDEIGTSTWALVRSNTGL